MTVWISPKKAERLTLATRGILARIPGFGIIALVIYLFVKDPIFPYHMMLHPWVKGFMLLFTDAGFRVSWANDYLVVTILITIAVSFLLFIFKVSIWNKIFKTLKVRTKVEDDKVEQELGRVYWLEGYSAKGWGQRLRNVLKAMKVIDIRIGVNPKKVQRVLKIRLAVPVYNKTTPQKVQSTQKPPPERLVFYLPRMKLINPFNPARSMHRLVITIPNDMIEVHDGTTLMIEGFHLNRDLTKDYPTFILTNDAQPFVNLDTQGYRDDFDAMIQDASFTTQQASMMDTLLMKDQRKFQEISVSVNPRMVKLVKDAKDVTDGR